MYSMIDGSHLRSIVEDHELTAGFKVPSSISCVSDFCKTTVTPSSSFFEMRCPTK